MFKVGDHVRLKEKFYDEPYFKTKGRYIREEYAVRKGITYTVEFLCYDMVYTEGDNDWCFHESLLELAEKHVVEVKRKAVNGEWIKITNGLPSSHQDYENGDIFQAEFDRYGRIHKPYNFCIYESEYVVLENYKPMRKWTESEITEAKCIIAEIDVQGLNECFNVYVDKDKKGFVSSINNRGTMHKTRCCLTDEYNIYIGIMVAMCKATGRELPKWIRSRT